MLGTRNADVRVVTLVQPYCGVDWQDTECVTVEFMAGSNSGFALLPMYYDCLCGLVVRSRGPGFDSRPYQIF
jgi:hypothetical protein